MSQRLHRRDFLRAGAAATAGFWIAGRQVGYGQEKSANAKLNIASIGCGGQGGSDLKSVSSETIVALCDVNKKRLEESRAKMLAGAPDVAVEGYRHYPELLARDDVHAVLIASPEHWHAKMAEDAIAAGKDVYLEKPMTLRLPDALRLKQVVEANDNILQVYQSLPNDVDVETRERYAEMVRSKLDRIEV